MRNEQCVILETHDLEISTIYKWLECSELRTHCVEVRAFVRFPRATTLLICEGRRRGRGKGPKHESGGCGAHLWGGDKLLPSAPLPPLFSSPLFLSSPVGWGQTPSAQRGGGVGQTPTHPGYRVKGEGGKKKWKRSRTFRIKKNSSKATV